MTPPLHRRPGALLAAAGLLAAVAAVAAGLYWLIEVEAVLWLVRANQWLADRVIHRLGYLGVFALMFIESSLVPFPSEVVIPPAGDLARRLPDWSLAAVVFWGTAGSLGGALFNYALARLLGRPLLLALIVRFGHVVRFSTAGYVEAERLFQRHGAVSTFTGRLLPGIRQLISLPAGLARMNLAAFCVLTTLGAGLWVWLLALLGYWFGAEPELMAAALKTWSRWVIAAVVLLLLAYAGWHWQRRRLRAATGTLARSEEP